MKRPKVPAFRLQIKVYKGETAKNHFRKRAKQHADHPLQANKLATKMLSGSSRFQAENLFN